MAADRTAQGAANLGERHDGFGQQEQNEDHQRRIEGARPECETGRVHRGHWNRLEARASIPGAMSLPKSEECGEARAMSGAARQRRCQRRAGAGRPRAAAHPAARHAGAALAPTVANTLPPHARSVRPSHYSDQHREAEHVARLQLHLAGALRQACFTAARTFGRLNNRDPLDLQVLGE